MTPTTFQQECLSMIRGYMADSRVKGAGWLRPSYVAAHIEVESGWNPSIHSTDGFGSIGLMQLLASTARDMGVHGDQRLPANSILGGMRYLSACRHILAGWFGGEPDYKLICAAYNEGPGNVERGRADDAYAEKWYEAQQRWAFVDGGA